MNPRKAIGSLVAERFGVRRLCLRLTRIAQSLLGLVRRATIEGGRGLQPLSLPTSLNRSYQLPFWIHGRNALEAPSGPVLTPTASLIPAQRNALGCSTKKPVPALKARFMEHEAGRWPATQSIDALTQRVALGWYDAGRWPGATVNIKFTQSARPEMWVMTSLGEGVTWSAGMDRRGFKNWVRHWLRQLLHKAEGESSPVGRRIPARYSVKRSRAATPSPWGEGRGERELGSPHFH